MSGFKPQSPPGMSPALKRTTLAVLLAPGFVAMLLSGMHLVDGYSSAAIPAYFMISYGIGLVPAAFTTLWLKEKGYTKLWQYLFAGFFCAVFCVSLFTVMAYNAETTSFDGWVTYFSRFSVLLIIGPLTGAFVWTFSEGWRSALYR